MICVDEGAAQGVGEEAAEMGLPAALKTKEDEIHASSFIGFC